VGCLGSSSEDDDASPASEPATSTSGTPTERASPGHAAPELEALLPSEIDGVTLQKGSTTGAGVFEGNAFGREMTQFLASVGKRPGDLRFANARDPSAKLGLEVGVFRVMGVDAAALRRAIVASSRPNAPGLTASATTLAGKRVTKVAYPGGSVLYLYEHEDGVFYVGSQREDVASRALEALP
jgi:hypothetical protein